MSYSLPVFLLKKRTIFLITEYKIAVLFLCLLNENIRICYERLFNSITTFAI